MPLHSLMTTSLQQPHVSSTTEQSASIDILTTLKPLSLEASLADPNINKLDRPVHRNPSQNNSKLFEKNYYML